MKFSNFNKHYWIIPQLVTVNREPVRRQDIPFPHREPTQAASLVVCSKYKEMFGKILKRLTIVKLYRGMTKLKVEINVNIPQLLCIVVSVALNGEFERFGGFCIDCYLIFDRSSAKPIFTQLESPGYQIEHQIN